MLPNFIKKPMTGCRGVLYRDKTYETNKRGKLFNAVENLSISDRTEKYI